MSILFDPQNKIFKINNKIYTCKNHNSAYYEINIKDTDFNLLRILDEKTENKNGNIIVIDRYGNNKMIAYENNEKIKNDFFYDILYFYYTTLLYDEDKICLELYKKYIEKHILIRANKLPNIDYMFDIYVIMNTDRCENISEKFNEIFGDLCKCANLRIHFMNIKLESYFDYARMCNFM